MKNQLLVLLCFLLATGCNDLSNHKIEDKGNENRTMSIALNDSAFKMIQDFYVTQDTIILDKAYSLLEMAINIDSTNLSAYTNIISVFGLKNDFESIIHITEKMLNISSDRSYAYSFLIGAYYSLGDSLAIDSVYKSATNYYQRRLSDDETNIMIIDDYLAFIEIAKGCAFAEKVLDSCIELYPKNERLLSHKERLRNMVDAIK